MVLLRFHCATPCYHGLYDWAVSSEDLGFLFLVPSLLFMFGSVGQIKLAIRQLFGARKYIVSHRIVS